MPDGFGEISVFFENLPIAQEDIEYEKKVEIFTLNTGEAGC